MLENRVNARVQMWFGQMNRKGDLRLRKEGLEA